MRYDSGQFGSFDGRDNRRTVLECFARLGRGLGERAAASRRAAFLGGLLPASQSGFAGRQALVGPCSAAEAYHLFIAVTGCLGVPVERAAGLLESEVRKRCPS
jgi:hypothetical protein